jgi:imidazolonepropionase
MSIDLIIHSASQLLRLTDRPQRGEDLGQLNFISDGALAISGDEIVGVGTTSEILNSFDSEQVIDATGRTVLPGLVDPHTHLLWVGDRSSEFELRIAGATYMEIMAAGGGISSTVKHTRNASVEEMLAEAAPRARRMLIHGTTTAEVKSGYGLETDAEIRMLDAAIRLDEVQAIELTPTFLGAHAIPDEYAGDSQGYIDKVDGEMLPMLKSWWLENHPDRKLPFVDVFCEEGAFTLDQSEQILTSARRLGFPLKIHADEFAALGGTGLAVRLGAVSADHLVHTPADEINALGQSDTVAVALPNTPFGLAEQDFTPAEKFIAAGAILALASDLNPGTAWCESMQFVIALACRYMGLSPAQAIAASTINAAAAIQMNSRIGSLHTGKQADLILIDADDYRHLGYRFGTNLVSTVVKKGKVVHVRL